MRNDLSRAFAIVSQRLAAERKQEHEKWLTSAGFVLCELPPGLVAPPIPPGALAKSDSLEAYFQPPEMDQSHSTKFGTERGRSGDEN
jgi:hypothetical protein